MTDPAAMRRRRPGSRDRVRQRTRSPGGNQPRFVLRDRDAVVRRIDVAPVDDDERMQARPYQRIVSPEERERERAGLQRRMREHQRRWDTERDYRLERSRMGWMRTNLRRVAHDWEARHADDEPPLLSPSELDAYNAEKAERRRAAQAVVEERRASRYATHEEWA
jgi:hypothetical protein